MITTVYTCDVGNYDRIFPPKTDDPHLRFICFTDNRKRRIKGWDVRPLVSPPHIANPTLINRYHKFFPHCLGFDTDWSVYVDGNMRVIGPVSELVDDVKEENALMACLQHPWRQTVEQEIDACISVGKIAGEEVRVVRNQYSRYLTEAMPVDLPLLENKVIIRSHNDARIQSAMHLWWTEFKDNAKRDQVSLPYVLWKQGVRPHLINASVWQREQYFQRYGHRQRGLSGIKQLLVLKRYDRGFRSVYRVARRLRHVFRFNNGREV